MSETIDSGDEEDEVVEIATEGRRPEDMRYCSRSLALGVHESVTDLDKAVRLT